jgi:hypothetical protein
MNLPYYLQFLQWHSTVVGGKSNAILATKLYIMLRSMEVVALLRVLSILHLAVCMPTRWLAAKSHELLEFDFGYYDMGKVLTCREQSFESIIDDPSLILDKEFMLEQMFKVISDQVDPFTEYIEHMYEQKVTLSVTGVNNDDLFYDDLRFNLFYPLPADIVQSRHICHALRLSLPWHFLKSSETRRNQPIIILTAQEASTVWEIYRRLNGSLDSALKLVIALRNQFMHRQHSR